MKLVATLVLLGLAAVARSDEDVYSSASAPQYYPQQYTSSYSNYHHSAPSHSPSVLESIFGSTRRQFGLGGALAGIGGPLIAVFVLGIIAIGLFAAAAYISTVSSGRGLDADEWEVDHSVWMNQLQKDFEDSWSTE